MKSIIECPICGEAKFRHYLNCKDHMITQEQFQLQQCIKCGFVLTNPQPEPNNLGKYYESDEYISHSNTRKGIVNFGYQAIRKYTMRKKVLLINKRKVLGSLLDIGCGTGEFLFAAKNAGWTTKGMEPNTKARDAAKNNHGLEIYDEAGLKQLTPGSFDVITMWHVLEHVPDFNERMNELKMLLKTDGLIVIALPNRNSYDAIYYGKDWAAYDAPRHLWHFCPDDIRALAQKHDLELKEILPLKFDSYYISLLSEKYQHNRQRIISAVWRGWVSNRNAGDERWSNQVYVLGKKNKIPQQ